jgi:hypothetical protein
MVVVGGLGPVEDQRTHAELVEVVARPKVDWRRTVTVRRSRRQISKGERRRQVVPAVGEAIEGVIEMCGGRAVLVYVAAGPEVDRRWPAPVRRHGGGKRRAARRLDLSPPSSCPPRLVVDGAGGSRRKSARAGCSGVWHGGLPACSGGRAEGVAMAEEGSEMGKGVKGKDLGHVGQRRGRIRERRAWGAAPRSLQSARRR